MHIPRKSRPRWAGRTRLLAVLAGLAIATLGLPVPALAAPVGVGTGQAAKPGVEPLCGTPEKGHLTCFALRRTDASTGKGLQPAVTVPGYGPADLVSAYQIPAA